MRQGIRLELPELPLVRRELPAQPRHGSLPAIASDYLGKGGAGCNGPRG
jgi:hypothetical protein